MLTKDLAKSRSRGDRIYPSLIDPSDPELIGAAAALIDIFAAAKGQSIGDVREQLHLTVLPNESVKPALIKLLFDQSEVDADDGTAESSRWEVLRRAEELRARGGWQSQDDITQTIAAERSLSIEDLKDQLYGDLPDCRRLSETPSPNPELLLHRYNCAQVQALLIRSLSVTIRIFNADILTRRRLFHSLKFHRLLGEVTVDGTVTTLTLSGPLSIFANAQSYGIRIATFFPNLLHVAKWELEAEVKDKQKTLILKLDQSTGIKSHYPEKSGHIPEEFQHCIDEFNKRYGEFAKAATATEFIHIGRESYCFPDLTIKPKGGAPIHIEIFHRWHASQLTGRLKALNAQPIADLRLAVDSYLVNKGDCRTMVAESAWFQQYGFSFSAFPTPKKIWEILGLG